MPQASQTCVLITTETGNILVGALFSVTDRVICTQMRADHAVAALGTLPQSGVVVLRSGERVPVIRVTVESERLLVDVAVAVPTEAIRGGRVELAADDAD